MGLKVWFHDDVERVLSALAVTVASNAGELSDYDRGRLAMLASVATAFGLDPSELGAERWSPDPPRSAVGSGILVGYEVKGGRRPSRSDCNP